MPTSDYAYISIIEATADDAAAFAVWLRDSYVPSPASVRFMSSFVMENGEETPWRLPATGEATDITWGVDGHWNAGVNTGGGSGGN